VRQEQLPAGGADLISLPTDSTARKQTPITTGVLDYFPDAIAEVARVSFVGNEQHNPGEPLHWAREKSTDHADCIARHLLERGQIDSDGTRHSAKLAWRALALLQLELEAAAQSTKRVMRNPVTGSTHNELTDPIYGKTCAEFGCEPVDAMA
jgi:hypothetical protein